MATFLGVVGIIILTFVLVLGIGTLLIMGAWNWALAPLFLLPTIDWPVAFGLMLLVQIVRTIVNK